MTALFSPDQLARKRRAPGRDRRRRRRLPTGAPRLVESSSDRVERLDAEAWTAFLDGIRWASSSRLELLRGRDSSEQVPCPWSHLTSCDEACRCGGSRTVTVSFLRDHYLNLAARVAEAVRRPS